MKKTKRYEKIFEEEKIFLKEMASVGNVGSLLIRVYEDHTPVHFHVIKKGEFEVKIELETLEVIGYSWKKGGKSITQKELNRIKEWLKEKYVKNPKLTNLEAVKIFWDGLNS